MTPVQRSMCGQLARLMADFYSDPENERRYQEWLTSFQPTRQQETRQKKRGPATNDSRALSITGQPEAYHTATATC